MGVTLTARPEEESESTEWETDTDASDAEEGDNEQVRECLICALLHLRGTLLSQSQLKCMRC